MSEDQKRKIYTSRRWLKLRKLVLDKFNHLCQNCKRNGKQTPADEVHHIIPLGECADPFDFSNLELLCKSCHSQETNLERKNRIIRQTKPGIGGWVAKICL